MDPSDQDHLKQVLASQGAPVGQHDTIFQDVMEKLLEFSNNVARLGGQLSRLSTSLLVLAELPVSGNQPGAVAFAPDPPSMPSREPLIPNPERYIGDLEPVASSSSSAL